MNFGYAVLFITLLASHNSLGKSSIRGNIHGDEMKRILNSPDYKLNLWLREINFRNSSF